MNWIIVLWALTSGALLLSFFLFVRQQRKIMERYLAEIKRHESIAIHAPPHDAVELLTKQSGEWVHHSFRPAGHRDIEEALATPGLAIRQDGVITEGVQDE